ncbi:MAG: 4-alpha-glucanotransferase [Lachnospiraceae bacterium]|nr:4-alpha-glucanotransferase [Lachnospiraceae bacterium]
MAKLTDRKAGILLHPSSLPSRYGIGDFGHGAYRFIDFLAKAGQGIWQVLPFGPTGYGDSPYQSFSAFAGQPLFISPELLANDGLLAPEDLSVVPDFSRDSVDYGWVQIYKHGLYHKAFDNFVADCAKDRPRLDRSFKKGYDKFREENACWLDDYALFMAIKDSRGGVSFFDWPEELRRANADKRRELAGQFEKEMGYYFFIQYLFFKQWSDLKKYANEHGISIVGDIPIFVSMDSADVWAGPELFQLDSKGYPTVVAGVPPDYFSETGQLWGNPLYDWKYHKKTGYDWWKMRIRNQLKVFDYIRIDHFRGFEAYWAVPYGDENAIGGKWCKGPDHDFFESLTQAFGRELPIWAEDLGIITDEVEALRDDFGLPGMKVLQFAFCDVEENDIYPHRFKSENCICYTGTHDNDTTRGWYRGLDEKAKDRIRIYMNCDGENIHWDMIRTALASVAKYAVYPIQDVLGYGSDCRMNTPSVASGNWMFRVREENFNDGLADYLLKLATVYGRIPVVEKEEETEEGAEAKA